MSSTRRIALIGGAAVAGVLAMVMCLILLVVLMFGGAQQQATLKSSRLCAVGGTTAADGSVAIPLMGRVTSNFGPRPNPFYPGYIPPGYASEAPLLFHNAVDIGGIPEGTPVNAVMGGTVIGVNVGGEEIGNVLKIDSGGGVEWRYVHLATGTTVVEVGQQVQAGQHLAGAGQTGVAKGVHLHLMLYLDGQVANPQEYLAQKGLILEKGQPPRLTAPSGGASSSPSGTPTPSPSVSGSKVGAQTQAEGPVTVTLPEGGPYTLSPEQQENASIIIGVARELNVSDQGIVVALMTALQESMLKNLANTGVPESMGLPHQGEGQNKDSVNMFQQRTSMGWGAVQDLMNPEYAARAFFGGPTGPLHGSKRGLLDIPGWEGLGLGAAGQTVQASAYPDAYDKWEQTAGQILGQVTGTAPLMCQGGGLVSEDQAAAASGEQALDEGSRRLEIPASATRAGVVASAERGVGGDYVWGEADFRSWDASGMVAWAFQDNDIPMPRQAPWSVGRRTETPKPGDIVAQQWDPQRGRWKHVGIYVGEGLMISAINESAGTRKHPVTQTGDNPVYFDVFQEQQ